jgi:hypothetical protein
MKINRFPLRHFIAALFLLVLPVAVQAQFTYVTNSDNFSITITGYTGLGGTVVIPNTINGYTVTGIGDYAFRYSASLTGVTIPDSVTSIGQDAFSFCTSLANVIIPGNVTNIGAGAFSECMKLTNVTISNGVTSIADSAFLGSGLTNIVIPNSVTSIQGFAFFGCPLTSLTISSHVTNIEVESFYSCSNLTSITIPAGVTSIGNNAFAVCGMLKSAYFQGNAPPDSGITIFRNDPVTVYYLPGTTGWGPTFSGAPAVLWNPHATALATIGGQFGFNITGPTNAAIVVVACTNLANPVWLPVSTNTLSGSGTSSFSDPQSANYPNRFYRFRAP